MKLPTIKTYEIKTLEDIQPAMLQAKEIKTFAETVDKDLRANVKAVMTANGITKWEGLNKEFVITNTPTRVEKKTVQVSSLVETAKIRRIKERIQVMKDKITDLEEQLEIEGTYKMESLEQEKTVQGRFAVKWKK